MGFLTRHIIDVEKFLGSGLVLVSLVLLSIIITLLKPQKWRLDITNKSWLSHIVLIISIGLSLLVIPPIVGKGYDVNYFIFVTDYLTEGNPRKIIQLDKPLYFAITSLTSDIMNVPGKLSIPISGILLFIGYVISFYFLTYEITKNRFLSSLAALFTPSSKIMRQLSLCFLGNLLGLMLVNVGLLISIRWCDKGKRHYIPLLGVTYALVCLSHSASAMFFIGCLFAITAYGLFTSNEYAKLWMLLPLLVAIWGMCVYFFPGISLVVDVVKRGTSGYDVDVWKRVYVSFRHLQYLETSWLREYVWVLIPTALGGGFIFSKEKSTKERSILMPLIILVLFGVIYATNMKARTILYLPIPLLAAFGIYQIMQSFQRENTRQIFAILTISFLSFSCVAYYDRIRYMNQRYYEEGPFKWDTHHKELEDLRWIADNYDRSSTVVMVNILWERWNSPASDDLKEGLMYRVLAEVGNNVYFGSIEDLLSNKSDWRKKYWGKNDDMYGAHVLGSYSSYNVDWVLDGKTIVVPLVLYDQSNETSILVPTANPQVYEVDRQKMWAWCKAE